jgi:rhodanese-related sulfurtransferase
LIDYPLKVNPLEISPQEVQQRLVAGDRLLLIDVREPAEFAIAKIDGAELIPMGSVPAQLQHLEAAADDATLVVFCHHGVRSLQVVNWLRQHGVEECQSMAGGIDWWSTMVDPAVPRY